MLRLPSPPSPHVAPPSSVHDMPRRSTAAMPTRVSLLRHGESADPTVFSGAVTERPIGAPNFTATVCKALGTDPGKTLTTPGDRTVRIVDKGEMVVAELFG